MWWSDFGPAPWILIGPMMMIIFVVVCMAMMFFMMRGGMRHRYHGSHAVEILKERYARGEINQTEYEDRLRLLSV